MYLYKMILKPNNSKLEISEDITNLIFDYLAVLYKNGQIMYNYEVVMEDSVFCAYCKLPEKNSLNKEYDNMYVQEYYNKLKEKFNDTLIYIGEDLYNKTCSCKESSWYMLYASYLHKETPVICGDCGKSVPLYKLPKIMGYKEYFMELYWQRDYQDIDSLYVSCLSDRFTYRQLSAPNSQLSKNGREICAEYEKLLKKPFYYYIANFKKSHLNCPICGEKWATNENVKMVDLKCDKCRLVTDKE